MNLDDLMHPDINLPHGASVTSRSVKFPQELESDFWNQNAQNHLRKLLKQEEEYNQKPKRAKNVILFMGDGMSLTTVAATRVHVGGEEVSLSFEDFPHFGLSKVFINALFLLFIYLEVINF